VPAQAIAATCRIVPAPRSCEANANNRDNHRRPGKFIVPEQNSIAVFGAGSIGCYVGGRLAAAGAEVLLIGRPRLGAEIAAHGLTLSDFRGAKLRVPAGAVRYAETAEAASEASLVLVTVKSAATADAGQALAASLRPDALVISFQNGLSNAEVLREALPAQKVLGGMVPFNVVNRGGGAFHQGSEGELEVQRDEALAPFRKCFGNAGLPLTEHADLLPVLWAKLLLNLNNPVNALSDLPLKAELSQRDYRRCVALAQREGLALLQQRGIRPARLTPLPPQWIPRLLEVPDSVFRLLANRMLAIDPLARSSMWEDLEAGRRTEIDWINGEIVRLARESQQSAPVNERLIALIRDAERGGRRRWPAAALLQELRRT
jgi:2-dehydropantoate 2-reductase